MLLGKYALLLQLLFQLLQSYICLACTLGDYIVDVELIDSVTLENSETACCNNGHTVLGLEFKTSRRTCEHHCLYGALAVFQCEINVSASEMLHIVGYLAANHYALQIAVVFQYRTDVFIYLCNCDYRHYFSPVVFK